MECGVVDTQAHGMTWRLHESDNKIGGMHPATRYFITVTLTCLPALQLIAHDKEVYDIAWGGIGVFASVSADGSVRVFDLRRVLNLRSGVRRSV